MDSLRSICMAGGGKLGIECPFRQTTTKPMLASLRILLTGERLLFKARYEATKHTLPDWHLPKSSHT
jgi:hypothetical protein